jgi:ABC-type lipoprotein export system ATPase subunit
MSHLVEISKLSFAYGEGGFRLAVDGFSASDGERLAIIGPSGCGKTTLLHLAAGILIPERGSVTIEGCELSALGDMARRDFRIRNIGLVFQEFELLEYLTVLDNILLPYRLTRSLRLDRRVVERAKQLAEQLEVADKLARLPRKLSQGERQRVAICRGLVTTPRLLLADEPTGNLDPANKERVLDLMLRSADEHNTTVLMVTHDHDRLDKFERMCDMSSFHATAAKVEVNRP